MMQGSLGFCILSSKLLVSADNHREGMCDYKALRMSWAGRLLGIHVELFPLYLIMYKSIN